MALGFVLNSVYFTRLYGSMGVVSPELLFINDKKVSAFSSEGSKLGHFLGQQIER